ncbi:MAG: DNA recombination protein RmuC [Pseudomonadota bacterium]
MMDVLDRVLWVANGPVMPEEAMALAEDQIRGLVETTTQGGIGQYSGWLIFVGVVCVLVALMFLMIAGRYRRERRAEEAVTSPLFEEAYAVPDEDSLRAHRDDLFVDDVIIEGATTVDERTVSETVEALDADTAPAGDDMPIPVTSFGNTHEQDVANVVPLHTNDGHTHDVEPVPEPVTEPAHSPEVDDVPRYAFATSSHQSSPTDTPPVTSFAGENEGERGNAYASSRSSVDMTQNDTFSGGGTGDAGERPPDQSKDDQGPFVAPFIREDIEQAERRQAERIDGIRNEFMRQFQSLKSEQSSRMDLVVATIDRKLEHLDRSQADLLAAVPDPSAEVNRSVSTLGEQVDRMTSAIDGQGQRLRTVTQILETRFAEVGRVRDDVKTVHDEIKSVRQDLGKTTEAVTSVSGELDAVKEHVGRLERAILDRAAQDNATTVRLADVIRGTLPDGSYSFGTTLANGETADCLINFDGLKQKIAVDASFPMEAFHELPSRDAVRRNLPQAKGAEDAFRRAILRAILEAGDRCISPTETADSCLLFMPSEAAYTILHDRFPDLVRDSQRARVWLVSPSTLMGTLNLIRNLLPDAVDLSRREVTAQQAAQQQEEDKRLRAEVETLRQRSATLNDELDRTRRTLRDLIGSAASGLGIDESLPTTPAAGTPETPTEEASISTDIDDDGVIDSLRFDGTPDWTSPVSPAEERTTSVPTPPLYGEKGTDPLR